MAPENFGSAPVPGDNTNAQDEIPTMQQVPLSQIRVPRKNQRKADLSIVEPAYGDGSADALDLLARVSLENGQGTHRPGYVVTGLDDGKTKLYMIPLAKSDSPDKLEVSYNGYRFFLNLIKPFDMLGRLVPPGIRESYELQATRTPIRIGNVVGKAVFISLDKPQREPIHPLTEDEKAKRRKSSKSNGSSAEAK